MKTKLSYLLDEFMRWMCVATSLKILGFILMLIVAAFVWSGCCDSGSDDRGYVISSGTYSVTISAVSGYQVKDYDVDDSVDDTVTITVTLTNDKEG